MRREVKKKVLNTGNGNRSQGMFKLNVLNPGVEPLVLRLENGKKSHLSKRFEGNIQLRASVRITPSTLERFMRIVTDRLMRSREELELESNSKTFEEFFRKKLVPVDQMLALVVLSEDLGCEPAKLYVIRSLMGMGERELQAIGRYLGTSAQNANRALHELARDRRKVEHLRAALSGKSFVGSEISERGGFEPIESRIESLTKRIQRIDGRFGGESVRVGRGKKSKRSTGGGSKRAGSREPFDGTDEVVDFRRGTFAGSDISERGGFDSIESRITGLTRSIQRISEKVGVKKRRSRKGECREKSKRSTSGGSRGVGSQEPIGGTDAVVEQHHALLRMLDGKGPTSPRSVGLQRSTSGGSGGIVDIDEIVEQHDRIIRKLKSGSAVGSDHSLLRQRHQEFMNFMRNGDGSGSVPVEKLHVKKLKSLARAGPRSEGTGATNRRVERGLGSLPVLSESSIAGRMLELSTKSFQLLELQELVDPTKSLV
ncbi:MAG: hypothetical protein JSW58_06450 [Candidatus Latescibacterota bacterium]|nr:MAG: hypothetical protein JSW58_06450 [Candidatus Latescibacterota bacterium]